ncbi:hypothetical protein BDB01DRAFT_737015 [Pilobolus umbonatus]|nr:hypothetical protein BDB01DRAFT_737015 [Pilobolus umbonatus]
MTESIMTCAYLSEYEDTVEALPLELQRNYTLIRQLDESAEDILHHVAEATSELKEQPLTEEVKKARLAHLSQLLNELIKKGEEKFALAKSTYDTIDRLCTRLDNDLQKVEDEQLIGPGRIHNQLKENGVQDIPTEEATDDTRDTARGKKRSRKGSADMNNMTDSYISTQDAKQHAQNAVSLSDLPIDPNEPVYCYCEQVSFGKMVACDNEECEIEWFHIECVGLKTPPKGKWYCDRCIDKLRKKKKI